MGRRTALKAGVVVGLGGALAGCSTPDSSGDVAATFVRVPARFERVTSFGVWVS